MTQTKTKSAKSTKGKKAKAKAEGTDRFGTRLGTKFAAANATLTKKPKTMKQIMDQTGLTATVYNHLNRLAKAMLIRRTEDGYCLKS